MKDLYAYLMTRPAVSATVPKNTVPFPLNIRALEEGWKILFFRCRQFPPNTTKSPEWNRGAYLAETLSDCTGCHTPRNRLGAEESRRAYPGYVVEGWIAPPLTTANPSPVPWTPAELFTFLRTGVSRLHSRTDATMTPVIRDGLALPIVPDADVRAIALYFGDMENTAARSSSVQSIESRAFRDSVAGTRAATLVDQVIDEITQGKQIGYKTAPQRQQTRQLQRPESDEATTDRGGRREYAETIQHSPAERLDLLLQALERAIWALAGVLPNQYIFVFESGTWAISCE